MANVQGKVPIARYEADPAGAEADVRMQAALELYENFRRATKRFRPELVAIVGPADEMWKSDEIALKLVEGGRLLLCIAVEGAVEKDALLKIEAADTVFFVNVNPLGAVEKHLLHYARNLHKDLEFLNDPGPLDEPEIDLKEVMHHADSRGSDALPISTESDEMPEVPPFGQTPGQKAAEEIRAVCNNLTKEEGELAAAHAMALIDGKVPASIYVGVVVAPKKDRFWLRSGCSSYNVAVCMSVEPFVLISEEGDMMWTDTVKIKDFEPVAFASKGVMDVCCKRYFSEYPDRKTGSAG